MSNNWLPYTLFLIVLFVSPGSLEWKSLNTECIGVPEGQKPEHQGKTNVIMDEVLPAVSDYLKKHNQTVINIPNQQADFDFMGLKGHIAMHEGRVSGFDQMQRFGDANIQYLNKGSSGSAALRFNNTSLSYKIETTMLGYTRSGKIKASLAGLSMRVSISVNLTSLCKKLDRLSIENLDSIQVRVDSGWLFDPVTSAVTNTILWIYKKRIVPVIERRSAASIQSFLDKLNLEDWMRPPGNGFNVGYSGDAILLSLNGDRYGTGTD